MVAFFTLVQTIRTQNGLGTVSIYRKLEGNNKVGSGGATERKSMVIVCFCVFVLAIAFVFVFDFVACIRTY